MNSISEIVLKNALEMNKEALEQVESEIDQYQKSLDCALKRKMEVNSRISALKEDLKIA